MRDRLTDVVQAIQLSRATFDKKFARIYFSVATIRWDSIAAGVLPISGFSPAAGALMALVQSAWLQTPCCIGFVIINHSNCLPQVYISCKRQICSRKQTIKVN